MQTELKLNSNQTICYDDCNIYQPKGQTNTLQSNIGRNMRSVFIVAKKEDLIIDETGYYFRRKTLKDELQARFPGSKLGNIPFLNDILIGKATGCLIESNRAITAHHVIYKKSESIINQLVFIFNFNNSKIKEDKVYIDAGNIFYGDESNIEGWNDGIHDWCTFSFTKAPTYHTPCCFDKNNMPSCSDSIYMLGHPHGLELKITTNAILQFSDESIHIYYSNLDAFHGNSGSPVFLTSTNQLIGILVSGKSDYILNNQTNTVEVNYSSSINADEKIQSVFLNQLIK